MKHSLLAFLFLIMTPALAGPTFHATFQEQVAGCANQSIAYGRYATMADLADDDDHAAFIAFIQQIADKNPTEEGRAFILRIGKQAWSQRGQKNVQVEALKVFNECYDKLGMKL